MIYVATHFSVLIIGICLGVYIIKRKKFKARIVCRE